MVAIVVTESFKFVASTVIVLNHLIRSAITYLNEVKSPPATSLKGQGLGQQLPETLPSIIDIKRVLPRHCFQPRVSTSMYYAIKDLVQVAVTYLIVIYMMEVPSTVVQCLAMFFYWAMQGVNFTAIFVIGHDCGHDSFSDYPLLNDTVGTVMHAFLMCPYYMWKLSHRIHHKNNCNLDKDEVYYPIRRSEPCAKGQVLPAFGFGFGWFGYLFVGYGPRPVNHFNPWQRAFLGHAFGCLTSLASLGIMGYLLYLLYLSQGMFGVTCYWFVPCFIFATFMVVITFLHHSEMSIPWYSNHKWDFVRGQLSTIDRHYGIIHFLIHSIGTHQMHHMFTKIPHYHLEEATRHFRRAYPHLMRVCEEPILPSFMRMFKLYQKQSVIDDDTDVHVYH